LVGLRRAVTHLTLSDAQDLGLQVEPRDGGWLAVRPASKLPAALAANLRLQKSEIISLLSPMVASAMVPSRLPQHAGNNCHVQLGFFLSS
jgi:hypothetical protein